METHQQLLKILEALNRVSRGLRRSQDSPDSDLSAIKALDELRAASGLILSGDPLLVSLSQHLSQLADSVQDLHNTKPAQGLISFVTRRVRSHEVSRLAAEIESELDGLIDRENLSNLTKNLAGMRCNVQASVASSEEDQLFDLMSVLQERLSRGFDIDLQDLLLKSGIFTELEWVLCNPLFSKRVREKAAISMKELVLFNKDVFVGSVLVGGSVKALISMGSLCSLQVLSSLIKAIKSPLVDEMESCGGILKIVGHLSSEDMETRAMAVECVMEIGYFGRKEAVESMINGGLIKRLVELQSAEVGVARERKHPFANCVARFAVQLEVGEGLRQREKRAFKQQILSKVREACVSDAESATIVAQVLWGSSP
ncbi:hypothetical protein Sango_1930800 [Sesamum angolense]|uniref:ARM repeat superfamily protein n=1 Tax=Sesamum angolense TaxID=2727404 RepID=A0AAE1WDU1_9LAMI|nr:hypothetical protein Sango_1930800 [Sesamum angolense]